MGRRGTGHARVMFLCTRRRKIKTCLLHARVLAGCRATILSDAVSRPLHQSQDSEQAYIMLTSEEDGGHLVKAKVHRGQYQRQQGATIPHTTHSAAAPPAAPHTKSAHGAHEQSRQQAHARVRRSHSLRARAAQAAGCWLLRLFLYAQLSAHHPSCAVCRFRRHHPLLAGAGDGRRLRALLPGARRLH